jgi:hypothetical protein
MMWCWLWGRGGVGVPGASCPRWRPKVAAAALRRRRSSSRNWMATSGRGALASYGEACARVGWGGGELVRAVHGDAVRGRSGRGRRRRNAVRTRGIGH